LLNETEGAFHGAQFHKDSVFYQIYRNTIPDIEFGVFAFASLDFNYIYPL